MTNDQSTVMSAALSFGLAFALPAWGDSAREACAALVNARSALWSMIDAKDKERGPTNRTID